MSAEFEIKKVSQETLGEYLFSIRQHFGYTIEEVSQKTGIFEKFISAIEQGSYQLLPPDVYVLGFLRKIAEVYKISCDDLISQYKKEKGVALRTGLEKIVAKPTMRSYFSNLAITPKILTLGGGLLFGVGAFVYILFQALSVNRTPHLTIIDPKPDTVMQGSSVVVKGETEPGISITVNGQNVLVDSDGTFETTLGVAPGQKDFQFIATNKFGKQKTETVSLRIDEPQVAGEVTQTPSQLVLELQFSKTSTISVKTDGVQLPEEVLPSGALKKITANNEVEVTTSDAGNTKVSLNGKPLGALGKVGQKITVPFTQEAQELLKENN